MQEDFTIEKITRHLRIEEETRKRDASNFSNSSNVNYVNEKPKKNKRKAPEGSNNNKNKNDCNLVKKFKRDTSQAKANLVGNEN